MTYLSELAAGIDPDDHGVGYLLAENRRTPGCSSARLLADEDIRYLVAVGRTLRGQPSLHGLDGTAIDAWGGEVR
jgi:hypothetical protein